MLAGGTAGFLPSGLTCTEADEMAKAGMFTASECVILRASGARLTWYVVLRIGRLWIS